MLVFASSLGELVHDLGYQMRGVLPCHSQCLLRIAGLEVHLDCKFRFPGVDVCGLCFGVLPAVALDEAFGLIDQDCVPGLGLVLTGHREG